MLRGPMARTTRQPGDSAAAAWFTGALAAAAWFSMDAVVAADTAATGCPAVTQSAPVASTAVASTQGANRAGDGASLRPRRGDRPVRISLSLIHISEPTRLGMISYAVFCL